MIKKGLKPSPLYQKIANTASDYMESNMSTKDYLKNEPKGIKRNFNRNIKNPQGLIGLALGETVNKYAPEGVYLNPTLRQLGYISGQGSNFYLEQPRKDELFRIGGNITF